MPVIEGRDTSFAGKAALISPNNAVRIMKAQEKTIAGSFKTSTFDANRIIAQHKAKAEKPAIQSVASHADASASHIQYSAMVTSRYTTDYIMTTISGDIIQPIN